MYIYRFKDKNDDIIYIGKAKSMTSRMSGHNHLDNECYKAIVKIEYSKLENNDESSIYERYLINKYKPKYNKEFNNNSTFRFELPEVKWKLWDKKIEIKKKKTELKAIDKNKRVKRLSDFEFCLNNIFISRDCPHILKSIFNIRDSLDVDVAFYTNYRQKAYYETGKSRFKMRDYIAWDDRVFTEIYKGRFSTPISDRSLMYFSNYNGVDCFVIEFNSCEIIEIGFLVKNTGAIQEIQRIIHNDSALRYNVLQNNPQYMYDDHSYISEYLLEAREARDK